MNHTWSSSCVAVAVACVGIAACSAPGAPRKPVEEAPIEHSPGSDTPAVTAPGGAGGGGGAAGNAGGLPTEVAGLRIGSTVASAPRSLGAPSRSSGDAATYNVDTNGTKFEALALKPQMSVKYAAGKLQSIEALFDDASQCKSIEGRLKSKFGTPLYSASGKTIWEQGPAGFELSCGPTVAWFTVYAPRH